MKKAVTGLLLLLTGAVVYGSSLVAAAVYSEVIMNTSWDTRYGIFGTALREVGTLPLSLAALVSAAGLFFIVQALREDWKQKGDRHGNE
ncbi:phosphatase [Indiicoccus explosivorum]|uniref:phosphatase n=1 Tax=Indiicoccus explosivorum TaxID=1917864 RepID=UPI000B45167F|nr:phosphatase [Indiicoccus explosivorum]